jgi:hypothetical protein
MNMQDKEFDELFRSKLGDLEVAPSKSVWDNIAAEVVIGRENRSALPFISIAASVLVLVTAGVFFIPQIKTGQHQISVEYCCYPTKAPCCGKSFRKG